MTTAYTSTAARIYDPKEAELFFRSPLDERDVQPSYGTLSTLRREVDFCMQIDRRHGVKCATDERALWAGAVTIMAGIDLLAKFSTGDDSVDRGKVRARFKGFLETFFHLGDMRDRSLLYDLRNSLVHSFSLGFNVDLCEVGLAFGGYESLITRIPWPFPIVDLWMLYEEFEKAVDEYQKAVQSNSIPVLQCNFAKMFSKYGQMFITSPHPASQTTHIGFPSVAPTLLAAPSSMTGFPSPTPTVSTGVSVVHLFNPPTSSTLF
jgi:hypothetical protein